MKHPDQDDGNRYFLPEMKGGQVRNFNRMLHPYAGIVRSV
jgi:cytochrome b subunit of formate dehydrogenase